MLVARLNATFPRKYTNYSIEYSKVIRNRYKQMYEDLAMLIFHSGEDLPVVEEEDRILYACDELAAFNIKTKRSGVPVIHANPARDGSTPNSRLIEFCSKTDKNIQAHLKAEDVKDRECIFFTSNIPLLIKKKDRLSEPGNHKFINMAFGVVPFGSEVHYWDMSDADNPVLIAERVITQDGETGPG